MMNFLSSFILLVSFNSFAEVSDSEFVIPSTVEVSPRKDLSVFDIVESRNMPEDLLLSLKSIKLSAEKSSPISQSEIAKMLRNMKAKFVLPNELKILRSKSPISRMEIERKIKNKINSNCNGCDIQITVSSVPSNLDANWEMDLNVDLTKGTTLIPISSSLDSNLKGWVIAEIKRYQSIPVLNRAVKVGDILSEDMFVLEKRQLANTTNTVKSLTALVGMQAIRFLSAGQPITFSDVKKEQILKKGQMVKAVVGNDSFEVTLSAEVQENGSAGDVIKIKNLDSQKVFAAKVIDRGLVRIE